MNIGPFHLRVDAWMLACFGREIADDQAERNHRFLEESLELVQALGCTASEAHQLVDYVFGRPVGEPAQECGGVMVTLAALCNAAGLRATTCGENELARVWTKVEQIRAKQAAKPKHSPLPERSWRRRQSSRNAAINTFFRARLARRYGAIRLTLTTAEKCSLAEKFTVKGCTMADEKDAADFVAENATDLAALAAERTRRYWAAVNGQSYGVRLLAQARLDALDRALAAAGIILPSDGGK